MRRQLAFVVAIVVFAILAGKSTVGQNTSLKEQLDAQYKLSQVMTDGSVPNPGTLLVIRQNGIQGVPLTDAGIPTAACKDGILHKPSAGSSFGASLLSGMSDPNSNTSGTLNRPFPVGDKVYVMSLNVNLKKDRITFSVAECAACSGMEAYKGAVSFDFAKGSLATMTVPAVQDAIARVFTIDTGQDQAQPEQAAAAQPSSFSGTYSSLISQAQLQLNPDGSFAQHGPGAWQSSGTFTLTGSTLILRYPATGLSSIFNVRAGVIYNDSGQAVWAPQGNASAPAPAPPPPATLNLPAAYVSTQSPTNQLQLNADHSFSLQEDGQAYHGTFTVSGNNLELTITESNTKTTATIQGNNLTDSGGQTWVYHVPSAQPAPPAAPVVVLQNADIVKMAKAGFDDAIITAKISNSHCQFDTSTDALIKLKQSGVSSAVLKAMVGAGK
jgi:hypothetical protein